MDDVTPTSPITGVLTGLLAGLVVVLAVVTVIVLVHGLERRRPARVRVRTAAHPHDQRSDPDARRQW